MAGDISVNEVVVVDVPENAPEVTALLAPPSDAPPGQELHILHRYGRVVITEAPENTPTESVSYGVRALAAAPQPDVVDVLAEVEQVGLSALKLRESERYVTAKGSRPRQNETWDMPSCIAGPTPPPGAEVASAPAAAPSTSAFLEGSVAVGIVIVEGPDAALKFSDAERTKVVAEVQNGLGWLAAENRNSGVTFAYDYHVVTLDVESDAEASSDEARWRDPAMAALGYTADTAGVSSYLEAIRSRLRTRWGYVAFFTKYPLHHFAYAWPGGPYLVMDYNNGNWGPDNIDRVFTHETGHIFHCPDEYASSGCTCAGSWGRFGTPNGNCAPCAPGGGVDCLMKANTFALCRWTPSHLGWARGVAGTPVLIQSRFGRKGNFELTVPSKFSGITHVWRNNDNTSMPWHASAQFGQELGRVDALTLIQSNYGNPGNLELIARTKEALHFFWRGSGPDFKWNGPHRLATGAAGNPVLIQSRFGRKGNFELICPSKDSGIMFMWRNNDDSSMPWSQPARFGQELGRVDALTLIQSNYGNPGNLELIARTKEALHFFWRGSGPDFKWNGPYGIL